MENALTRQTRELLARAIHVQYRLNQTGRKQPDDPAMVDWSDLPEHLRESSRQQAAHIFVKLEAIGYSVQPADEDGSAVAAFTDEELERLSELEHDRWVAERLARGWRPGERDVAAKRSPYLVSWRELPDDVREWDRDAVRAIPELLAGVGLEIVRRT